MSKTQLAYIIEKLSAISDMTLLNTFKVLGE